MARQVYFDPFGSYVSGYDTGVQREQSLQKSTREARREDAMLPFDVRLAQRDDELGVYSLPARKQAVQAGARILGNQAFDSDLAVGDTIAKRLGVTQPMEQTLYGRGGFEPTLNLGAADGPQVRNIAQAQIKWDQALSKLPDLADDATPEEIRAQDAYMARLRSDIAAEYGIAPDAVTAPLPEVASPMVEFVRPDGQVVGSMVNPRESLLRTVNRPDMLLEAERQRLLNRQAWEDQYKLRELQTSEQNAATQAGYLDFQRSGGGSGRAVGAEGLW